MAAVPSDFHMTGLNKDDLQISETGKVAFKNKEIADAIEFELAERSGPTERRGTDFGCTTNTRCRPER